VVLGIKSRALHVLRKFLLLSHILSPLHVLNFRWEHSVIPCDFGPHFLVNRHAEYILYGPGNPITLEKGLLGSFPSGKLGCLSNYESILCILGIRLLRDRLISSPPGSCLLMLIFLILSESKL
jgi:hypothetical protein